MKNFRPQKEGSSQCEPGLPFETWSFFMSVCVRFPMSKLRLTHLAGMPLEFDYAMPATVHSQLWIHMQMKFNGTC